jgi:DNA-cytosine methyltransferase
MIDLLIGGSPCQGFSFAGKQLNFEDERSKLFFEYVKALETLKPKYFLLENVKMKKEYRDVISKYLGVEPIEINSSLLSAQNRKRLYWTNIPGVTQPQDKGILLKDIVHEGEVDRDKSYCIDANYYKGGNLKSYFEKHRRQLIFTENYLQYDLTGKGHNSQDQRAYYLDSKHGTLPSCSCSSKVKVLLDKENIDIRILTPIECERLQTLPDNYTEGISNTQRYKCLGNGWTVDVIAHILSFIPETNLSTVVSLFDGVSCGQVALERTGKFFNRYYASEIDKYAMQVTMKNYPNTIQIGDVTKVDWSDIV